ncbi:hypothetical protein ACFQ3P_26100 [Paraburkholderia sabiae]|uniref:Uncharacterized protein n=1 Tax=Paraburkholderia sabiae TaxID=273251 RepID=A0ABU9QL28_9BURK|nr:hypothetical protein [Paraburkholderia sabiae]WJZ77380.1 hypothetical protein QEN71_35525 [Paraburkholderia sabiae]CAD6547523.1 hypothetical protein LMG24235_04436 [Paraburkholderia sabiae]
MNWVPPKTFEDWEDRLVAHFLRIGPEGDASTIRSFEITDRTLAQACGAPLGNEKAVVEQLRNALLQNNFFLDALKHGSPLLTTRARPNLFTYLVATLYIDGLLDSGQSDGAYRAKLAKWLAVDGTFQQLQGVAHMWRDLVVWLDARISAGEPFRRLVLPAIPSTWTHIGYTRRLSFPGKPDVRLLERFVSRNPAALDDPSRLITLFRPIEADPQTSWGLRTAFGDFSKAYLSRKRAIADHPFWSLLTRVAANAGTKIKTLAHLDMVFDEDGDRTFIVGESTIQPNRVHPTLDTALRDETVRDSVNLASVPGQGIVFFYQCGAGRWRAESRLRRNAVRIHVAFEKKLVTSIGPRLGSLLRGGSWFFTEAPQAPDRIEALIKGTRLVPGTDDHIFRAAVRHGIRVNGAWLGRPGFLPEIDADTSDFTIRALSERSGLIGVDANTPGQLVCQTPVEGPFLIEPARTTSEDRSHWRIRVSFVRDAMPRSMQASASDNLRRLVDWRADTRSSAAVGFVRDEDISWEQGDPRIDSLIEALYADGSSGWDESELVRLVSRATIDATPWTLMRVLHDSGLIEPRLRSGWRGRVWTLRAPQILCMRHGEQQLAVVEGAVCVRLIDDFRIAVESLGGAVFRRNGVGAWSPPVYGAVVASAAAVAERLHWPVINNACAPSGVLELEQTPHLGEMHSPASSWDWNSSRFTRNATSSGAVKLTRLVHGGGRDHDLYKVECRGRTAHYLSRTSAIVAAHSMMKLPLFEARDALLVRLAGEGGLPDALAEWLRRRHLRSPGLIDGAYVYPVGHEDRVLLHRLLPGCIGELTKKTTDRVDRLSIARRSGGRVRMQWRNGTLCG